MEAITPDLIYERTLESNVKLSLYSGPPLTRSTFNTSIELFYCLIKGAFGLTSFPTCQGQQAT